ncbi:MAG: tyrosine-type recombinase/integrase [Methylibium sp.]|nr:tyrosine-type recombinase/integrase [Methylibium sp.]MBA3623487.1 tyrosine-type recombinase/integrase [Methylibium sp.]
MALTEIACRTATCPTDKLRVRLTDGAGLYLEILPTGGKYWRLKYRFTGKEKKLALGVYGKEQGRVSVKEARARRDEARRLLSEGIDPGQQKKTAKLQRVVAAGNSFECVARAWWAQWASTKSAKHADQVMRRLEADVFPAIGALPVSGITAPQLLAVSLKIERRGAVDIAKRAYQSCGQVLRYAVAHGLAERNAAADVKPSDALKPACKENYARIDVRETPELLRRIDAYDGAVYTRLALRLMALTFVRTSELIGARWCEFERGGAQWRIPAERMKMKTPHIVPLSRQALAVLDELAELRQGRELLFPGERDHNKPMSNNTILYALYRMGYHSRMTGHGFRGLASTILHELGHRHDLIELQLAHQERNAISAAYNHATYIPKRTEMMQEWADHLDALKSGGRVMPLRAA